MGLADHQLESALVLAFRHDFRVTIAQPDLSSFSALPDERGRIKVKYQIGG